jgi:hypothetical protein
MKIFRLNWLGERYADLAARFADVLFTVGLLCGRLAIALLSLFCVLFVALAPAGLLWQLLSPLVASTSGKVVFAVLWTALWVVSIVLLNCMLGPVFGRLSERYSRLTEIIDKWLKDEGLSND